MPARNNRTRGDHGITAFISANVRKLKNKVARQNTRDYCTSVLNNAKVVCITETWLTMLVPDHIVALSGYNLYSEFNPKR